MSRKQGPRIAGMRPAAIAASRRQQRRLNDDEGTEAAARANRESSELPLPKDGGEFADPPLGLQSDLKNGVFVMRQLCAPPQAGSR